MIAHAISPLGKVRASFCICYPPVGNQDLFERTFSDLLLGIAVGKVGQVAMLSNSRVSASTECPICGYHMMRPGEGVVFDILGHCKSTPIDKNTSHRSHSHSGKCLKNIQKVKMMFNKSYPLIRCMFPNQGL